MLNSLSSRIRLHVQSEIDYAHKLHSKPSLLPVISQNWSNELKGNVSAGGQITLELKEKLQ